jgi:hypothetical protein
MIDSVDGCAFGDEGFEYLSRGQWPKLTKISQSSRQFI